MKHLFVCSLCHNGLLGGALYLEPQTLTYKTNKLTVDNAYRNLVLPLSDIDTVIWKQIVFPIAVFRMKNGREYKIMIFNKARFCRLFASYTGQ